MILVKQNFCLFSSSGDYSSSQAAPLLSLSWCSATPLAPQIAENARIYAGIAVSRALHTQIMN